MPNRTRTNRNEFHLSDDEQFILDKKFEASGMKSKSTFLRTMILYGYVYDVDYSFLQKYNAELERISSNQNQLTKRINAIKATVDKAIAYICNEEKKDEKLLISSYACSPETAAIDFKYTLAHTSQHDENKAYLLIQSFLPGEVSFNEAHQIGQELADRVLEGKYSFVVSTHIDKSHVHNHIIFCVADNMEYNKYHFL